jgi:hypothetical protein
LYDPIDHIANIRNSEKLRVMVIGDPNDKLVPYLSQNEFQIMLASRGIRATMHPVSAKPPNYHFVSHFAKRAAALCHAGKSANEIQASLRN